MTRQDINATIDSNPALQLVIAEAQLAASGGETVFGHQALAALHSGDMTRISELCIDVNEALNAKVTGRGAEMADAAWTALNGAQT